jgi:GT2 family glycosyltransferase
MITICLVAYSKKYTETTAFQSLLAFSTEVQQQIHLIVFDNGKVDYQGSDSDCQFNRFAYHFNNENERGTRIAYQYALDHTRDQWLMLLDDDTELTEIYLQKILREIQATYQDFVAYMPVIKSDNGTQISPTQSEQIKSLNFPLEAGDYSENITGISSGLVLSIDFLKSIGGFSTLFPLDYLDHWLFYKIIFEGRKVRVIESYMVHQLSVMDLKSVSKARYQSIFESEYQFYQAFRPNLLNELRIIYLKRIFKGLFFRQKQFRWWLLLKILLKKRPLYEKNGTYL